MYALNVKKGTIINHPEVKLPGLVAVPVSDHLANQVKHIINVVVFDRVEGKDKLVPRESKHLYNLNPDTLEINKPENKSTGVENSKPDNSERKG